MMRPVRLPVPYVAPPPPGASALVVTGRWTAAFVTTSVLLASIAVAGVYVDKVTRAGSDAGQALIVALAAIGAGIVFGMLPMFFAARVYAKVVYALLSVFLVTSGFLLVCFAPLVRQIESREVAEYRAFAVLTWFGVVALVAGTVLAAMCVRWVLRPRARRVLRGWSRTLGSAYGVLQGLTGLGALLAFFSVNDDPETSVVEATIAVAAIAMLALVPGLMLTYHGISAAMGEGSGEIRLPGALWGWLIFSGVLLVGGLNMSSEHPVAAPMPVLHALAAALPGLTFVAMAGRGNLLGGAPVPGLTWRQVMLAAAISMTLGVLIATYVEGVGAFGAILLTLAHNGIVADGVAIGDAIENAQAILSEGEQFVVNLVAAAVLAPLVEEFAKGLGVRLMMTRRTTRGQAFLLGAAAGAGFGFLEALLYGLGGIQDGGPGAWWEIMLVRGGSTSLHVFNTALVGLAWWHWSNGGSQRAGWVLFVAAVLLHALWNGLAVTLYSRLFVLETLSERTAELIAIGLLVPLALSFIAGIPLLARRLREPDPPPVAGTPLEVMRPWLSG